jgi:hypothetical protein
MLPAPSVIKRPKTFRRKVPQQTRAIRTEILRMRITEKECNVSTAVSKKKNVSMDIFGVNESYDENSVGDSHAVATHSWIRDRARIFTAITETTVKPEVALTRMLRRHCLGVEAYERGDVLDAFQEEDARRSFILIGELSALLHWCWGMYHPGGRMLNEEAKEETVQNLVRWHTYQVGIKVVTAHSIADKRGGRSCDSDEEGYVAQLAMEDIGAVRSGPVSTSERITQAKAAERIPAESLSARARNTQAQVADDCLVDGMAFKGFSAWFLLLASQIANINSRQ